MEYQVKHALQGRIRLRLPALKNNPALGELLQEWLKGQPGIQSVRLNAACYSLVIEWSPETGTPWLQVVSRITPQQLRGSPSGQQAKGRTSTALARGTSTLSAAPVPIWRSFGALFPPTISLALSLLGPAGLVLNLALVAWTAMPIWKRALQVLWQERRLNVDFLDGLAILIAVSQAQLFTAAFVIWLIAFGDWIRDRTAQSSKRAISKLLEFQNQFAWVLRGKQVVQIPASDLAAGNTVIIYPGEMVPVDGEIVSGVAMVDQRMITGESMPVTCQPAGRVFAGTVIREGKLKVLADRVGSETTAAQIVHMVESAPLGETRIQNYAEKFADGIVAPWLAAATGLYALTGNLDRLLSMMIIDYGTGMRVAAPTSVLSSMKAAAHQGILIKSGSHMEKLACADTVIFDKTGTLTRGMPHVLDLVSYDERNFPVGKILQVAAAVEARLKHPLAEAIVAKARAFDLPVLERRGSRYQVGMGIEAQVNGYHVHLGSSRFMRKNGVNLNLVQSDLRGFEERGCSTLVFAVDGQVKGLLPCSDQIRPEAQDVIRSLHALGIKNTIMLTGDNQAAAQTVAGQLGLDRFCAETLPEDKAGIVRALQAEGRTVAMIGDGINDSPALAYADVGIAMKNGADVARESADVVLMEDNLWKLVTAIELSRGAMSLVKQNYTIIATLNTVAVALCIPTGLISAGVTAAISNGSTILAGLNAMRPLLRERS